MKVLNYREITDKNYREIIRLWDTLTEPQKHCVAPNVYSIAEGSVHRFAYYRGIYLEDTPVGFFMLDIPDKNNPEDNGKNFYLWRFMIARDFQGKNYGKEAIEYMASMGKELGFNKFVTSCQMGEGSPYQFYLKCGFVDTHEMDGTEEVLEMDI